MTDYDRRSLEVRLSENKDEDSRLLIPLSIKTNKGFETWKVPLIHPIHNVVDYLYSVHKRKYFWQLMKFF